MSIIQTKNHKLQVTQIEKLWHKPAVGSRKLIKEREKSIATACRQNLITLLFSETDFIARIDRNDDSA